MKNRVYESLTTVFSVLVVSSFLYIWFKSLAGFAGKTARDATV